MAIGSGSPSDRTGVSRDWSTQAQSCSVAYSSAPPSFFLHAPAPPPPYCFYFLRISISSFIYLFVINLNDPAMEAVL